MGEAPRELGAVVSGDAAWRREPDDITIADLPGAGAQDTNIATLALKVAKAAGLGTSIRT